MLINQIIKIIGGYISFLQKNFQIFKLLWKTAFSIQFIRFLGVGVINTLIGFTIIFACMYLARLGPEISNLIGYVCGVIISFFLNKKYTFNSNKKGHKEAIRFLIVFGIAYTANLLVLYILIHNIHISKDFSQIYAGIVYTVTSYLMNKYYVFTDSISKNPHISRENSNS